MEGEKEKMVSKVSKCHICKKFFDSKKDLKDHMDRDHRIVDQNMAVTPTLAERIADDILSRNDGLLSISVMDKRGNTLSAKSKQSFKALFGAALGGLDGNNDGGALAIATLSVVNQVRDMFGEPQAIITIHKSCKLMLLSIPSCQIMLGLVFERWVDVDDDIMANYIQNLVTDTIANEMMHS